MQKLVKVSCFTCHKKFKRLKRLIKKHNFCSKKCFYKWKAKEFYKFNKTKNPMTHKGKVPLESRIKRRETRIKHRKKPPCRYLVYMGKAEHRVVAEKKLKRKLKKNEVVHHVDGNIHNNNPSNLMVFKSNAEHIKYHAKLRRKLKDDSNR